MSRGPVRDRERAAKAIDEFLRAMGHEPRGELEGTAARVAEAWDVDLLSGEGVDLASLVSVGAIELGSGDRGLGERGSGDRGSRDLGLVGLRGVDVASMCPHHLLPSHGRAMVAYAPGRKAAGLGTIAQVVHAAARRLVLQESMGVLVAEALVEGLGARGALCQLSLTHTCLVARGERQAGARVDTIAFRGSFEEGGADRPAALVWLSMRPEAAR